MKRVQGLTLIEILTTVSIFAVVLGILAAQFSQQAKITRLNQARNEVQTTLISVTETVSQDLQTAGSNVVESGGSYTFVTLGCSASGTPCVSAAGDNSGTVDTLQVVYATSLRPSAPCRSVGYKVDAGTLLRSDVPCGNPEAYHAFADGVSTLDIRYLCGDTVAVTGSSYVDKPGDCYARGSYPRDAVVSVRVAARHLPTVTADQDLAVAMPNLKDK